MTDDKRRAREIVQKWRKWQARALMLHAVRVGDEDLAERIATALAVERANTKRADREILKRLAGLLVEARDLLDRPEIRDTPGMHRVAALIRRLRGLGGQ